MDKFCEDCIHNEVCQYYAIPPHKDRCNDKDTIDDIFPMEIVAGKCPIEAGGNCPLRPQDEATEEAIKVIDEILEENDIMGDVYLTERMMKALKLAQEALKKAAQNDKMFHVEHTTKGEEQ